MITSPPYNHLMSALGR